MQEIYVPTQEVADILYRICEQRIDTYELQPPDNVAYPFCYMGEQVTIDVHEVKHQLWTRTLTTIHLYDIAENKANLRVLAAQLNHDIRHQSGTRNFHIHVEDLSVRFLNEREGNRGLAHGVIEVDIQATPKRRD